VKLEILFKDYLQAMLPLSNEPLRLHQALKPFGINSDCAVDDSILVGHLLDHMGIEWGEDDYIDAIDVSVAAMELGHRDAEKFLDEAPFIMVQLARSLAS